jgi:hypothetical protein
MWSEQEMVEVSDGCSGTGRALEGTRSGGGGRELFKDRKVLGADIFCWINWLAGIDFGRKGGHCYSSVVSGENFWTGRLSGEMTRIQAGELFQGRKVFK